MSNSEKPVRVPGVPVQKAAVFLFLLLGILLSGLPAQEEDEEEAVVFKGIGLHVRLGGGYSLFSGGDFKTGIQGMYDLGGHRIVSAGYTLGTREKHLFSSGYELGGDLVYYFAGRLGIGVGGTLTRVNKTNEQLFRLGAVLLDYPMRVVPHTDIFSLRIGVFYAIPLNSLLTACFNAGPAFYSADYKCNWGAQTPGYAYSVSQRAKAKEWGVQGGIGLEVRMNERLAFILEAQGRFAKISGFEGEESLYENLGGPVFTSDTTGTLYYVEKEGFPRLEVFPAAPAVGLDGHEAVFDFSGISLRAGLNFKF
jgi:hypothetical protein